MLYRYNLIFFIVLFLVFSFSPQKLHAASKKEKPVAEAQLSMSPKKSTNAETSKEAADASSKAEKDKDKKLWLDRASKSEFLNGKASWYGRDFHNKKTASGVPYDMYTFTAAHRTLPMGTVVKVTDQENGKSVMVCVTDRGPYVQGRVIDLSYAAAQKLNLGDRGVSRVKLEVVSDEKGFPLRANKAYFVEYPSDNGKKSIGPFSAFSDAAAMHEAVRQAHPEANVVLDNTEKK